MKMIHISLPEHPEATLEGYILDCELTLGQERDRPAIVVLPGGGYTYCSPREAEPVALKYAASGFHAFILRYSTGSNSTCWVVISASRTRTLTRSPRLTRRSPDDRVRWRAS